MQKRKAVIKHFLIVAVALSLLLICIPSGCSRKKRIEVLLDTVEKAAGPYGTEEVETSSCFSELVDEAERDPNALVNVAMRRSPVSGHVVADVLIQAEGIDNCLHLSRLWMKLHNKAKPFSTEGLGERVHLRTDEIAMRNACGTAADRALSAARSGQRKLPEGVLEEMFSASKNGFINYTVLCAHMLRENSAYVGDKRATDLVVDFLRYRLSDPEVCWEVLEPLLEALGAIALPDALHDIEALEEQLPEAHRHVMKEVRERILRRAEGEGQ